MAHQEQQGAGAVVPAAAPGNTTGQLLASLKTYNGEVGHRLDYWISSIERAASRGNWSQEFIVDTAADRLTESAEAWYMLNCAENRTLPRPWATWVGEEGLKAALKKRFSPDLDDAAAVADLRSLVQRENENVRNFHDRIRTVLGRFHQSLPEEGRNLAWYRALLDHETYRYLYSGCRPDILKVVTSGASVPTTRQGFIDAAAKAELRLNASAGASPPVVFEVTSTPSSSDPPSLQAQLDKLTSQVASLQVRRKGKSKKSAPSHQRPRCTYCQRPGHWEETCWVKYPEKRPLSREDPEAQKRSRENPNPLKASGNA